MRQAEDDARALHDLGELLGLFQIEGHWLVAHDIEPSLRERLGDLEVRVVGSGDGDEVDFVRPLGFSCDHLLVRTVCAVGGDVIVGGRGLRFRGIGGERAGDECGAVVEHGRGGVDAADEGPLAPADQSHAQLAIQGCIDAHWCDS